MSININPSPAYVDMGDSRSRIAVAVPLSDSIEVGDGSTTVFKVPENCFITSLTVDVETAFDAGGCSLEISDSDGRLMFLSEVSLMQARPYSQSVGKELAGGGSITATLTDGSATEGTLKVWMGIRTNSTLQNA